MSVAFTSEVNTKKQTGTASVYKGKVHRFLFQVFALFETKRNVPNN